MAANRRRRPARASRRDAYLKKKYGISLRDYERLFAYQGGRCAICGREPLKAPLNVDHDHRKKGRAAVRGLLCAGRYRGCNRLLGRVDDAAWLEDAWRYVSWPPFRRMEEKK